MNDTTTPQPPADDDPSSHTPPEGAGQTPPPPPPPPAGDAGQDPPPPPPPPPAAARPLLRRDHDKHLAGVAGGLADYFGVDAGLMRIVFVILAIFGIGLPLYLVGWVAMPSPSMPQSYVERWFGRSPNPAAILAIAAGIILLLVMTDAPHGGSAFGWGLALLFGGWLLFRADGRASMAGVAPPVMGPPTPAGSSWYGAGGTATAPTPPWTPAPPKPRSMLGRLTVGVALASVGVAALVEQLRLVALEPVQYAALALTVVGLGLVAGAWVGRAYWLIAIGFVLLPVTLVLAMGPMNFRDGAGDVHYAPTSLESLQPRYELGAGELDLDLSDVDFSGTTEAVAVSVGLGSTVITVPDDVTVAARVNMRAGEVDLFGERLGVEPFRGPFLQTWEGTETGGRLELDVDSTVGELVIRRDSEDF